MAYFNKLSLTERISGIKKKKTLYLPVLLINMLVFILNVCKTKDYFKVRSKDVVQIIGTRVSHSDFISQGML